jgi:hypothetical protein
MNLTRNILAALALAAGIPLAIYAWGPDFTAHALIVLYLIWGVVYVVPNGLRALRSL